jgi:TolB-like protein
MSDKPITKEQYVVDYVKSLAAIEEKMEPFKEHRRDLKKNYVENGWLTREEVRIAVKAYRLIKGDVDIQALNAVYNKISSKVGV